MEWFDVAVIGAGPAGLAAATVASNAGRSVVLMDAAERPGGQFWRHRADDPAFASLRERLSRVDYRPGASVWFIEPGFTIHYTGGSVAAQRLVIATGAYDRVVPFPGWDLPGVVTAGGAQALLKGQGVAVGRRVVVAGTGPFLLPVAAGLAQAGARVVGVFEAASPLGYLRGMPPVAKIAEAARYLAVLARHRVPYRTRRAVVAAHSASLAAPDLAASAKRPGGSGEAGRRVAGTGSGEAGRKVAGTGSGEAERRLVAVTVVSGSGRSRVVECDALAIGYGFTPQVELAIAAGCATRIDADGSLTVTVGGGQTTSVPGVFAAGEVTGVGGAQLAIVEGQLAGLAACGLPAPPRLVKQRDALRRFASLLAKVHPVPDWRSWPDPGTILCRCERVPVSALRQAIGELGVVDGRGAKLMTRVGMGWCQGRVCGYAASCLVAQAHGRDVEPGDLLAFATRPIASPVTLNDLATGGQVCIPPR